MKIVREKRDRYPHIKISTDFDILDNNDEKRELSPNLASCDAGRKMISISYSGDIYPCAFFATPEKTFSAGNIYHDSVISTWRNASVFLPFRVQQKSSKCRSCQYYQRQCVGGCPAIVYSRTGLLDAHDSTCFVNLLKPRDKCES